MAIMEVNFGAYKDPTTNKFHAFARMIVTDSKEEIVEDTMFSSPAFETEIEAIEESLRKSAEYGQLTGHKSGWLNPKLADIFDGESVIK